MIVSQIRILAVLLVCLTALAGCNRSKDAEVAKVKTEAEAEASKAEATKAVQAQPKVDADRRAAEWVLLVKGSVKITTNGVESEVKNSMELPKEPFKLVGVRFEWGNVNVTNDAIAALNGASGLRELLMGGSGNFGDAGAMHFRELKNLISLSLDATQISDTGIESIAALPNLETLTLNGTKVSDKGMEKLAEMKNLKVLWLSGTSVSDVGLQHLGKLSQLETIQLADTKISDAGIAKLKEDLPKVRIDGRK